jgi:rhamnulose-1-phosphate aldolase/alcohol dehydrogenase
MRNQWLEQDAVGLSGEHLLVYQARIVGADSALVTRGGGNVSLKVTGTDFRGLQKKVLLIKGSGVDMGTAQPDNFPAVNLEDLLPLFERSEMADEDLTNYLVRCLMEPDAPRPSIETLLHAFLQQSSVVHTHADAILSLSNTQRPDQIIRDVFGASVAIVPYFRPGFLLSKEVAQTVLTNPKAKGVILLNHGLVTWGVNPKNSYEEHIDIVGQAEEYIKQKAKGRAVFGVLGNTIQDSEQRQAAIASVGPMIRRLVADGVSRGRMVVRFDGNQDTLNFIGSEKAQKLVEAGAATPDHLLSTKRTPVLIQCNDPFNIHEVRQVLEKNVVSYEQKYIEWFRRYAKADQEMLSPHPRVILVSGLGMWTVGRDISETLVTADIYRHTIAIMAGAEILGGYASLTQRQAYDAEYWPQELYKLSLLPPERELSRRIALITGAAHGIGQAIARRFALEGANLVLTDIDYEGVEAVSAQLNEEFGSERTIPVRHDVTSEEQTRAAVRNAALAYGGLDILVSNAGIAPTGNLDSIDLEEWQRSLQVNATGHLLVAREAIKIMKEQGFGGSLVFIATKNVLAPGRGFGAYSAAKSAEVQVARVLAMENGMHGIRSNIINPDAVFQNSGLWSEELRRERAEAHNVRVSDLEDFYRKRNLLETFITPSDVAQAALFFASDRSAKTTGCILTVDGGVPEAFPR